MKTMTLDPQVGDLYQQIETTVGDRGRIYAAAKWADEFLLGLTDKPVVEQEELVTNMNLALIKKMDLDTDHGLRVALASAAVLEAKRRASAAHRRMTASETIIAAVASLAKYYETDL